MYVLPVCIELQNSCEFTEPPPVKECQTKGDPAVDAECGLLGNVKHNPEKSGRFSVFGE
jgi:hypothetical protein